MSSSVVPSGAYSFHQTLHDKPPLPNTQFYAEPVTELPQPAEIAKVLKLPLAIVNDPQRLLKAASTILINSSVFLRGYWREQSPSIRSHISAVTRDCAIAVPRKPRTHSKSKLKMNEEESEAHVRTPPPFDPDVLDFTPSRTSSVSLQAAIAPAHVSGDPLIITFTTTFCPPVFVAGTFTDLPWKLVEMKCSCVGQGPDQPYCYTAKIPRVTAGRHIYKLRIGPRGDKWDHTWMVDENTATTWNHARAICNELYVLAQHKHSKPEKPELHKSGLQKPGQQKLQYQKPEQKKPGLQQRQSQPQPQQRSTAVTESHSSPASRTYTSKLSVSGANSAYWDYKHMMQWSEDEDFQGI